MSTIENLEAFRRKVQEKVEAEKEVKKVKDPGTGDDGPSLEFVKKCFMANEVGDSLLYNQLHKDVFINNVRQKDGWMHFDGHFWKEDLHEKSKSAVEAVAQQYLRLLEPISKELKILDNDREGRDRRKRLMFDRKQILARLDRLRSDRGRNSVLNCAVSNSTPLTITSEMLDQHPWYFPCANGIVDMRTGDFRDGLPADYITIASPTRWEGLNAACPNWEQFLLEIFDYNLESIEYLQRILGYTATGLKSERIFIVLYGPHGQNGKGTMIETIYSVMGPLAGPIQTEMLMSQKFTKSSSGPSPDIMALKGLRLAWASETEKRNSFAAGQIKRFSGGDHLIGRGLNDKKQTTFEPTHVLFLLCNDRPSAPPHDSAFWERIKVFEFPFSFVATPTEPHHKPVDRGLSGRLAAEAPGILAWMVRGCKLWQEKGLAPPQKVIDDSLKYREHEDDLKEFLDECCMVDKDSDKANDIDNRTSANELYKRFVSWWQLRSSYKAMSQKDFSDQLQLKGFKKVKNDRIFYQYIRLVFSMEA